MAHSAVTIAGFAVLVGLSLAPFFPATWALLMAERPTARQSGIVLAVSGLGAAALLWWMAALWQGLLIEGHATQMLLNRTQEHVVWRTILEADEELASLRTVDSLAEIVADAWRLLCRYEGQRRLRGADGSTDTRAFQRW